MSLPFTPMSRPIYPNAAYHHGVLWEPLHDRIVWQCTHLHKRVHAAMRCAKIEWTRRDRAGSATAMGAGETPMTEETTTQTEETGANTTVVPGGNRKAGGAKIATGKSTKPAAAAAAKDPKSTKASKDAEASTKTIARSRQGVGAAKGEVVRIVRRKNEERDGNESWHIWQKDTNRNVVPTRFPSEAAARAHAKKEGWVAADSRGNTESK